MEIKYEKKKTNIKALERNARAIEGAMFFALAVVAIMQLISMITTRRRVLRPVIAIRDQMGKSQREISPQTFL